MIFLIDKVRLVQNAKRLNLENQPSSTKEKHEFD